jgi:hydroxyacylglutathione hydrolase/adenylyltransferase/sulfurtransferase
MSGDHPLSDPDIEITPEEAERRVREGTAVIIDIREQYEWDAGRIAGARHIEIERLASKAPTIDKDTSVVFQCRAGARSLMAAQAFRRAGYDAYSMAGGLEEWHRAGFPLEPEDGTVAAH